ncbi:MAG: hypothetical protein WCJ41_08335 [Aestuariivirga sp.]|uniref:hypothetical protein n=1 Tax=Aestuariivirga sp. TaxID=2650926 RepID=UPI00301827CD
MMRPQIRPGIFIGLQNGMAAALFATLLAAELNRRLLYTYPNSGALWWFSTLANRTVMPLLRQIDRLFGTPDKLLLVLLAGIAIPLLAWRTRYWFATALSGHLTLAALAIITYSVFQRGRLGLQWTDLPDALGTMNMPALGLALLALCLLVLVMCIADHVAFIRFFVSLIRRLLFKE